jgi:hypothetical protein
LKEDSNVDIQIILINVFILEVHEIPILTSKSLPVAFRVVLTISLELVMEVDLLFLA